MLIDGENWEGYEFHFKSGKVFSVIGSSFYCKDGVILLLSRNKKEHYAIHGESLEFTIETLFGDCTSWDDPEVQEWLKEHAQKIMREEK